MFGDVFPIPLSYTVYLPQPDERARIAIREGTATPAVATIRSSSPVESSTRSPFAEQTEHCFCENTKPVQLVPKSGP